MSYLRENLYTKQPLKFKNGKFRILCISDLHGVVNFDKRILRDLAALLDKVQPDLVMVLGDMVWRDAMESPEKMRAFVKPVMGVIEERSIPWAHVFGNHDNDCVRHCDFSQQEIYEEFALDLAKRGPAEIHGKGNYVLPIFSGNGEDIVYNVWALDSHDSMGDFMREFNLGDPSVKWDMQCVYPSCLHDWGKAYDTFNFDQLMWYWQSSVELEKYAGHKIPGLMTMHMALPEYRIVYKNTAETYYEGTRREAVGNSPVNSGLFNAMLDRGDIKTVCCGHDHINDFSGSFLGIRLCNDAGLNYDGYCDDDLRGGRVFDIVENDPWNIKTYMVRAMDCVENYPGECERVNGID